MITYRYDIEDYRIVPMRITTEWDFEKIYQVQYNEKWFGLFDRWVSRGSYKTVEKAVEHIEHATGGKFE